MTESTATAYHLVAVEFAGQDRASLRLYGCKAPWSHKATPEVYEIDIDAALAKKRGC